MDVYILGGSFVVGFIAFIGVSAFKAYRSKSATVCVPKEEELAPSTKITVHSTFGAHTTKFDVPPGVVGDLKNKILGVYSIPSNAVALINGKEVGSDFPLSDGLQIEWVRPKAEPIVDLTKGHPIWGKQGQFVIYDSIRPLGVSLVNPYVPETKPVVPKIGSHIYPPKFPDAFFQLHDGMSMVRLLPPASGSPFFVARRQHYNITRSGKVCQCGKKLNVKTKKWEGDCSICDLNNRLWRESEDFAANCCHRAADERRQQAREIKAVERYYYNAYSPHWSHNEPRILAMPKALHEQIVKLIIGDELHGEEGYGDISDLETGRDIKILKERVGAGWPRYVVMPRQPSKSTGTCATKLWDLERVVECWEKKPEELQALVDEHTSVGIPKKEETPLGEEMSLADDEFLAELEKIDDEFLAELEKI